jgi:predicted small lipoprotein YifL
MRYVIILTLTLLAACAKNEPLKPPPAKSDTIQVAVKPAKLEEWKEKEIFHNIIAETFHPLEQESDFKPVMTRAQELADKAKAVQTSLPPSRYQSSDTIKTAVGKLVSESQLLADVVKKKGKEPEVKKLIFALHDQFHELEDACYAIDKKLKAQ